MSGPALWFVTRATGVTALILLTITVALGLANVRRLRTTGIPRFVLDAIHRDAALLAMAFLVLHVVTTIADTYVKVPLIATLVPFTSGYKPLWVGLGAVSLDLVLAVMITSLARKRIGHRVWRATHWLAYGSWPVAMFHSLGIGTDRGTRWMMMIALGCAGLVGAALVARWSGSRGGHEPPRPEPLQPARRRASARLNTPLPTGARR